MINGGLSFVFKRANAVHGFPNIVQGIEMYKITKAPDAPPTQKMLTGAKVKALLAACQGNTLSDLRDRTLLTLGIYTGMRTISLASMETTCATVERDHVALRVLLKGGDWYHVPIDRRVWDSTKDYRAALKAIRPQDGPLYTSIPLPRLVPHGTQVVVGNRLSHSGIYGAMTARAEAANLAGFHPHILRHTFVTWCRLANVDPRLVAVITGHKFRSDTSMVDYYTDKAVYREDAMSKCYEAVTKQLGAL
jgi:integrase